jgi:hypothetical protein
MRRLLAISSGLAVLLRFTAAVAPPCAEPERHRAAQTEPQHQHGTEHELPRTPDDGPPQSPLVCCAGLMSCTGSPSALAVVRDLAPARGTGVPPHAAADIPASRLEAPDPPPPRA